MSGPKIIPVARVEVRLVPGEWEFARRNSGSIDAHWQDRTRRQPQLYNGEYFMLSRWRLDGDVFAGECIQTDFKSFLYWRDHDAPDRSIHDFFPAAALHTSEGWLVLGRTGPLTSNPGLAYPPLGSPEPADVHDGRFDVDATILRETREETGIAVTRDALGPPLLIVDPPRMVVFRPVRLNRPAQAVVAEIAAFLAATPAPELSGTVLVRSIGDIDAARMPPYTIAYIRHALG